MPIRNPNHFQAVAIVDSNLANAYRLKSRLLSQGYRQVDVFLSRQAFRDAVREGYTPDQIFSDGQPTVTA